MSRQARLESLSDSDLLERLSMLVERHRKLDAEVVAHLAEVDERRLYLGQACSSMFAYCTELLHFSEAEAYLRIAVARASRRFPVLLAMLGDGRLHLSGIARLAPHLDADNIGTVTARAAHMSKREIDELVAELSPSPDVPARVRKLPVRLGASSSAEQLRPDGVDPHEPEQAASEESSQVEAPAQVSAPVPQVPIRPSKLEPIAPSRYKVEFTAGGELRDKLERARALLRHKIGDSSNDLAELDYGKEVMKLARGASRKGTTRASEAGPMPRWNYLCRPGGRGWPVKARASEGGPQKGPRSLAPVVLATGGGRPPAAPRMTAA